MKILEHSAFNIGNDIELRLTIDAPAIAGVSIKCDEVAWLRFYIKKEEKHCIKRANMALYNEKEERRTRFNELPLVLTEEETRFLLDLALEK